MAQLKWLYLDMPPPRCVRVSKESYGKPAGRVRNVHSPLLQPLHPHFSIPSYLPHPPRDTDYGALRQKAKYGFQALCSVTAGWVPVTFQSVYFSVRPGSATATEVVSHLLSEEKYL